MHYSLTGKKILVTGGSGFIGRHLVKRLAEMQNSVTVLARKTSDIDWMGNLQGVTLVWGELQDRVSLNEAAQGKDLVYHLGAKLHVSMDSRDPELHQVNVTGTRNLLDACISNGVPQFIYFSSAAVMLDNNNAVMDETTECNPPTEYGRSKLQAEKLVADYHERYDLITTILRPVVVYGEGEWGNVVKFIESIKKGQFRIIGDGTTERSLVHVNNVVEAALLVTLDNRANGKTYVLTDGDDLSIKKMARFISSKLNVSLSKIHIPRNVAYLLAYGCEIVEMVLRIKMPLTRDLVRRLTTNQVCSSEKIQEELGFAPSSFDEGMSQTLEALEAKWRSKGAHS